jgi:hypothetical protein
LGWQENTEQNHNRQTHYPTITAKQAQRNDGAGRLRSLAPGSPSAPCSAGGIAFGDVVPKVNQTFNGSFSSFTVAGVPIDRDALVSEASLNYAVSNSVTVGVSYSGQYGRRASNTAFKGHVDVSF